MKQKRPLKPAQSQAGASANRMAPPAVSPPAKKLYMPGIVLLVLILGLGLLGGWLIFSPAEPPAPVAVAPLAQSPAAPSAPAPPPVAANSPPSGYRSQPTDVNAMQPKPGLPTQAELARGIISDHRESFPAADAPWPCALNDACPRNSLCNVSTGKCVYMGTGVSDSPVIHTVYPTYLAPGDTVLIDGDGLYMEALDSSRVWKDGRWQIDEQVVVLSTIKIGDKIVPSKYIAEPDECRMIVRVPEGFSGPVSIEILPPDGRVYTAVSKEVLRTTRKPKEFQDCSNPRLPKATGKPGIEPQSVGPYASAYFDTQHMDINLRIHYPAQCGGLRTPVAAGKFPLVAILHGRGSAYLNYEFLARHLATWGFVVVLTDAVDIDVVDTLLTQIVTKPAQVVTALAPHIDPGGILLIGHSRGGTRASNLLDHALGPHIKGIVMLAPFNPTRLSDRPLLLISASEDVQAHPASVEGFFERHKSQTWHFGIRGGNHSQFTDRRHWDRTEGLDGKATLPRNLQHDIIRGVVLAFAQKVYGQTELFPEVIRGELLPSFLHYDRR